MHRNELFTASEEYRGDWARRWMITVEHHTISLNRPTDYETLTVGREAADSAVCSVRAGSDLRRLVAVVISGVAIAVFSIILAAVCDRASITIVGIDSTQDPTVMSDHIVHDNVTSASIVAAVATASDNLTIVISIKVFDVDSAEAVKLNDLVRCMEGSSPVDVGGTTGLF